MALFSLRDCGANTHVNGARCRQSAVCTHTYSIPVSVCLDQHQQDKAKPTESFTPESTADYLFLSV